MLMINPYLLFAGNAEEAFTFYKSIFGGEFSFIAKFQGSPGSEKLTDAEQNQLMHVALPMGKNNLLMASDTPKSMGYEVAYGNGISLCVHTESREEADTIFNKLSDGATIEQPLADMFWGDYYGLLTDKFAIRWMIIYSTPRS